MSGLWEFQVRTRRALRRLSGAGPPPHEAAGPLFFHHVAKTGGTSLIRAIRALLPTDRVMSEHGDLSLSFTTALARRGLRPGQFVYGHPGTGAVRPLVRRVAIATVLRDPGAQAVSNYLWIRQDPNLPDHAVARACDLRGFLQARPYFAIFQTASLHLAIQRTPVARTEEILDRLPMILDYLGQMEVVGTTGRAVEVYRRICDYLGVGEPPPLPHHRKAKASDEDRRQLADQYQDLTDDPTLGPLLAGEQEVYRAALALDAAAADDSHLKLPAPPIRPDLAEGVR